MRRIIFLLLCAAAVWGPAPAFAVRVVSLSPALTETIFALGGGPLLVGRSAACNRPAAAAKLPVAGDFATPNLEVIVSLNAELVVADTLQDPTVKQALGDLGVRVEVLPLNSLDDYEAALTSLGGLLNLETAAAGLKAASRQARRDLASRISGVAPVKTLLLFWDDPPMSCGRRAFFNDLLALAGGVSVTGEIDAGYFYPSPEVVAAAAPEAVVYPANGGMTVASLKKHLSIPAVAGGRMYAVEDADLIFRLTPRWPEAVVTLRGMLHPELDNSGQPSATPPEILPDGADDKRDKNLTEK
ncbi:MAG: helical backbone metal receptor [Victivallaceae bacterium]|nr:helical backbone metal receptor [Victivallaceae bacterium]